MNKLKNMSISLYSIPTALITLSILICLRVASTSAFSSTGITRHEDVVGLQALFNSTLGPSWTYTGFRGVGALVKWDFAQTTVDPCVQKWAGVTCSPTANTADADANAVVSQLSVPKFGLKGKVPIAFALVKYLTSIDVSANSLTNNLSDLLDILYSCTSLYKMYINQNYITGNLSNSSYSAS